MGNNNSLTFFRKSVEGLEPMTTEEKLKDLQSRVKNNSTEIAKLKAIVFDLKERLEPFFQAEIDIQTERAGDGLKEFNT